MSKECFVNGNSVQSLKSKSGTFIRDRPKCRKASYLKMYFADYEIFYFVSLFKLQAKNLTICF